MGSQDARPRCMVVEPGRFGERCILDDRHEGPHEFFIPEPPVAVPDPACYCGYLGWTVERYGRVTHKQGCPARTDPWHQGNPQMAEVVAERDALLVERQQLLDALEWFADFYRVPRETHDPVEWHGGQSEGIASCPTCVLNAALVAVDKEADRD